MGKKDHEQIYFKIRLETCTREYNTSSAQNLHRDIRALVTEDYDSVDCDSCHPSCMIIVCNRLGIEVPEIIMDIVMKKKGVRKCVAKSQNVSAEEAKQMINIYMYGGNVSDINKSEWLNIYSKTIKELVPRLVSSTDVNAAKVRITKRSQESWKNPNFSALSDRLARVEWQLVYHAQQFLATKGYKINNIILIFDGIEVHRPSDHDTEITTDILNGLYDYI